MAFVRCKKKALSSLVTVNTSLVNESSALQSYPYYLKMNIGGTWYWYVSNYPIYLYNNGGTSKSWQICMAYGSSKRAPSDVSLTTVAGTKHGQEYRREDTSRNQATIDTIVSNHPVYQFN